MAWGQCLRLLVQVKCHIFSRPRAGIRLIRLSQRFVPQSAGNFVSGHFILYSIALNVSSKAFLQTPPPGHPENFIDFLSKSPCRKYGFMLLYLSLIHISPRLRLPDFPDPIDFLPPIAYKKARKPSPPRFFSSNVRFSERRLFVQKFRQLVDGHANLLHGIPVAHGDAAILQGFKVDRDAIGRPDLILAAIPLSNAARQIIIHRMMFQKLGVYLSLIHI